MERFDDEMLFERLVVVVLIDLLYGKMSDIFMVWVALSIQIIGVFVGILARDLLLGATHILHIIRK